MTAVTAVTEAIVVTEVTVVIVVVAIERGARPALILGGAFLVGWVGAVAYLIARADAPIAWGDTHELPGAIRMALGMQYSQYLDWSAGNVLRGLPASERLLLSQLPIVTLPVAAYGAWVAWTRLTVTLPSR